MTELQRARWFGTPRTSDPTSRSVDSPDYPDTSRVAAETLGGATRLANMWPSLTDERAAPPRLTAISFGAYT
jgi:hypothetical protein